MSDTIVVVDASGGGADPIVRPMTPEEQAQKDADRADAAAHIEYVEQTNVSARVTTTDDLPLEVFRFPCDARHLYEATLRIKGVDVASFATRQMVGEFAWKRVTGNAIMTGITVVSSLGDAASSTWAPNALPSGTDISFTVKGAAGRTIDWFLIGSVGAYAPEGL